MHFPRNKKRWIALVMILFAPTAILCEHWFRPLRWWFYDIFVLALLVGLMLNQIGWKEELRHEGDI